MKKVFKLKKMLIAGLCLMTIVLLATEILATEPIIIGGNEYDTAQNIETIDDNTTNNASNALGNTIDNTVDNNTTNNSAKRYNSTNNTTVPQTGIEDYNIGILLIIAVASAIFAYRKIKNYNNI